MGWGELLSFNIPRLAHLCIKYMENKEFFGKEPANDTITTGANNNKRKLPMNIKSYFNKESFVPSGPATKAIFCAVSAGLLLSAGTVPLVALGVGMVALTAGQVNRWQAAATGAPLWKPVTGHFGL